jgi:hypothetical protein
MAYQVDFNTPGTADPMIVNADEYRIDEDLTAHFFDREDGEEVAAARNWCSILKCDLPTTTGAYRA